MARYTVRVHPRARADRVIELTSGEIEVWTHAPALDGRANDAVIRLVADLKGVPPSGVELVSGARSRTKVVQVLAG